MRLINIVNERKQINEAVPAAVIWVAAAIASAVAADIAIKGYENWLLYLDKTNYNPDPKAIPDEMRMRGKDGKWMQWNADRGRWRIPKGSPMPSAKDLEVLWNEAINQSFASKMLGRKFNFDAVTEDDMRKAIFAAKSTDVSLGKTTTDDFNKMHNRWVVKGRSETWRGQISKKATSFFRIIGLTGSFLSVTAFAYYYIQAREIKEAIDDDYRSGAITSAADYEKAIMEARAAILPVIAASILAMGVTQLFFIIISWATDKLAGKGTMYKMLNKFSKVAQLGFGAASVYLVASERGRQALSELMMDVTFADGLDNVSEIVWNWLGGNWQMFWSDKGLADPDLQSAVDSAAEDDPNKNPNIKVPSAPSSGESNLEKFF